MDILRAGSRPSGKGPAEWFTGSVRIDPLFNPPDPARVEGAHVTFEPGARTAWHTHPLGQTLIVTCGSDGRSDGAARSRRSGPATSSASRPAKSTGTARPPTTAMTPYRHPGGARRQARRLAGAGHGRAISRAAGSGLTTMPHIIVKLWTGKSEAQKSAIAQAITQAIMASADSTETSISVSIEDFAPRILGGESL